MQLSLNVLLVMYYVLCMAMTRFWVSINLLGRQGGGGCSPFNGPYGEALAEKITFFRLEVY